MTKKILLGVTGCIAAYKSCEIVRGLQKQGFDVSVVMTHAATRFVGEATFDALCDHRTYVELFDNDIFIPHISLAEECDTFLIAPCTANVMAKIVNGIADDLLTSCALACPEKLIIAPAMNVHMYENPATQYNLNILRSRNIRMIEPDNGRLACGDVGKGKLASVDDIVRFTASTLYDDDEKPLAGKRVLITSGPTQEMIDDIRFISNHSSGKMGSSLAKAALDAGAKVTIISGPVSAIYPGDADVVHIVSAQEMDDEARRLFEDCDIAICAAAVADYSPKYPYHGKLKKGIDDKALESIEMVRTADILKDLAKCKKDDQVVIGFAAETENLIDNAMQKLTKKGADMIVANDVSNDQVFDKDSTHIYLVTNDGIKDVPTCSKDTAAIEVINAIINLL